MSDVSGLSHEYASASSLSAALNRSLVILKKDQLRLPGAERLAPGEIEDARQTLAAIAQILALLLREGKLLVSSEPTLSTAARIPPSLVARLREEWRGSLPWRLDDFEAIGRRLRSGDALTQHDFARLDELARAAEAETSKVFRLMMRTT